MAATKIIEQDILSTSLKLFNERGYHNVTTNHIAEAMGKSPATIYYYFRSKEDIVRRILPSIQQAWLKMGLDYRARAPEGEIRLDDLLHYMTGFMSVIWEYRFYSINTVYLTSKDPDIAHAHASLRQGSRLLIRSLLEGIRDTPDVNDLAIKYSQAEDDAFVTNIELILDNWVRYLQVNEKGEISKAQLNRGVLQVLAMLLPWLAPHRQKQVRQWLTSGLPEGLAEATSWHSP